MATQNLKLEKVYKDLDLSFAKNPATGDIAKKIDVNSVKQSIKILLQTNYFERPFQPNLGTGLQGLLFETINPTVSAAISQSVTQLLKNYEPRVKVIKVISDPDYDNNGYSLTINFYVVGVEGPQQLGAFLRRIR